MLKVENLHQDVFEAIANRMELDSSDEDTYRKIAELTPREAFNHFLCWHGFIGWAYMIETALDNIRECEINPINP